MTTVSIKYFASVREALGSSGEIVQTTATTVAQLRDVLIERGGMFAQVLGRGRGQGMALRVALDHCMTQEDALLTDGCEVAFFPPVTGG